MGEEGQATEAGSGSNHGGTEGTETGGDGTPRAISAMHCASQRIIAFSVLSFLFSVFSKRVGQGEVFGYNDARPALVAQGKSERLLSARSQVRILSGV